MNLVPLTYVQCDLVIDFCVCFWCCLHLFQSCENIDVLALEYSLCFLQLAHLSDVVSQGRSCLVQDIDEGMCLFMVVCVWGVNLFQFESVSYDS